MRLAVVGSRSLNENLLAKTSAQDIMHNCIRAHNITHYVSGGATGPDIWGEEVAEYFQLTKTIYKPDWKKYGKSAGFKRNKLIISDADHIILFWDGISKGTNHDLNLARESEKIYELFLWKNDKWSLIENNIA